MTELEKVYLAAPSLESPPDLDERILQSTRLAAEQRHQSESRSSRFGVPALAFACMCIVGGAVAFLLQSQNQLSRENLSPADVRTVASVDAEPASSNLNKDSDLFTTEDADAAGVLPDEVLSDQVLPELVSESAPEMAMAPEPETQSNVAELVPQQTKESSDVAAIESVPLSSGVAMEVPVPMQSVEELNEPATLASEESFAIASNDSISDSISKRVQTSSVDSVSGSKPARSESLSWLMQQNPDHVTLQLVVSPAADLDPKVVSRLGLRKITLLDQTLLWLHGSFEDKAEAITLMNTWLLQEDSWLNPAQVSVVSFSVLQ